MDCENKDSELRKIGSSRTSSAASSLRRRSLSLSFSLRKRLNDDDDDDEIESVSEAGDIGDRELQSNRYSGSGRLRLIDENAPEHGVVVPISEGWSHDPNAMSSVAPVSPSKLILQTEHKKNVSINRPFFTFYNCCLYLM